MVQYSLRCFAVVFLIGLGVDLFAEINQTTLFICFYVTSLLGVLLAVLRFWPDVEKPGLRVLLVLGALIVWRVAYFPILVFAGWVAALNEWLLIELSLPTIIYPIFLLAITLMHWAVVYAGAMMIHSKKYRWGLALVPAFIIATLVSFTNKVDLTPLPDYFVNIEEAVPAAQTATQNPYSTAFSSEAEYNLAETTLLFASGSMYQFIPDTPWSASVKGVLESLFNAAPKASSTVRVKDHYLAYRRAHDQIGIQGTSTELFETIADLRNP